MGDANALVEQIRKDFVGRNNQSKFKLEVIIYIVTTLTPMKLPSRNSRDEIDVDFDFKNITGGERKLKVPELVFKKLKERDFI